MYLADPGQRATGADARDQEVHFAVGIVPDFRQKVDVTSAASVEAAVGETIDRWGAIQVLVNNAGILRDGQLLKIKDGVLAATMSDEQFDAVIAVNLKGVFHCTRAVAPRMIQSGGGVILNASSVVGLYGNFGQTNYVATKAGVIGMTRVWARGSEETLKRIPLFFRSVLESFQVVAARHSYFPINGASFRSQPASTHRGNTSFFLDRAPG